MNLGAWGEQVAAGHLERMGWAILSRNFRSGRREIDLVAQRGGVVAFVEVKTRSTGALGDGLEAITPAKQRSIAAVAVAWIYQHGSSDIEAFRFDVITVAAATPRPVVRHYPDAWRMTESNRPSLAR